MGLLRATCLAGALAALSAAAASAANLAPNPGFELACGSPTKACFWWESSSADWVAQRDDAPSNAHTGTASYRLEILSPDTIGLTPPSDCQPAPAAGNLPLSYWYRTTSNVSTEVEIWFYDDSACTSFSSAGVVQQNSIADGLWHQVSGSVTAEAKPFNIRPGFFCAASCPGTTTWFDDLAVGQVPTAVRVSGFRVVRTRAGVWLRWRTAAEVDLVGFNVYREEGSKRVRINGQLIPGVFGGTAGGHAYFRLDRRAPGSTSFRYRLQAVDVNGKRSWLATATLG
jgi:hypothetical protein